MKHFLIFWRKPNEDPLEQQIRNTFSVLMTFTEVEGNFAPRYLTTQKKDNIKEFEWTLENFSSSLKKHPVNKGNQNLGELGYQLSFFSNTDEENSLSFRIIIGNRNPLFYDILTVSFPNNYSTYNPKFSAQAQYIFEKCVALFNPFWGCITEKTFLDKYRNLLLNERPTTIHWINYWSDEIIFAIGAPKIYKILSAYDIKMDNGVFMLQKEPPSLSEPQVCQMCDEINYSIGLQ